MKQCCLEVQSTAQSSLLHRGGWGGLQVLLAAFRLSCIQLGSILA